MYEILKQTNKNQFNQIAPMELKFNAFDKLPNALIKLASNIPIYLLDSF